MSEKYDLMMASERQHRRSLMEIHAAVLFFGLAGLFGKLVSLPATIIVLGRVFFATLFLAGAVLYLKQSLRLKRTADYLYLLLLGLILAVHWVTFFQSIRVSTVAIGLLTYSTFPVFVTFLEPYFFRERLCLADVLVALIAFCGIGLVIPEFRIGNGMTQGVLWGVASGLTFAVLSLLNRKYVRDYSSLVIALYQDFVAMIALTPFLFLRAIDFRVKDILLLALLGVVFTGVAHSLFIKGLGHINARTASIIACLEPVYGIVLAIFLLGEIPTARVVIGGTIILVTAAYATLTPRGARVP
jgi:drug/metabolite transporter (DMT)-like permease